MLASAGMGMMNTKGLALQSSSPSHKALRRRKTTHAGVKKTMYALCVGVLKETKKQSKKQTNKETW